MCALSDDISFNDGARQRHRHPRARGHGAQSAPSGAGQCALGDGQPRRRRGARRAGASRCPERLGAQSCGVPTGVSFGGVDPRTGRNFVFYESYCGGMGATRLRRRRRRDQHRHVECDEHPGRGDRDRLSDPHPPLRARARHRRQRPLSRRPRHHPRVRDAGRELDASTCAATAPSSRRRACTAASTAPRAIISCSTRRRRADARSRASISGQIRRGDRLRVTTPGGGGYGAPADARPRAAAERYGQREDIRRAHARGLWG